MQNDPVLRFVNTLRSAFHGNERIYTQGHCFEFFLILKSLWPEAEPWYDHKLGHVFTKINGCWYDIDGKHVSVSDACTLMEDRALIRRAYRWAGSSGLRVVGRDERI